MKKLVFTASLVFMLGVNTWAQQKICIAFYNQENLFDTIDDPTKNDNEFLPIAKKQWNSEKYLAKLANMSKVITSINEDNAPDILGMCEVENKQVVIDLSHTELLKKHKYQVVHFEGPDERSIDNALMYKSSLFKVLQARSFPVNMSAFENSKTRDILFVRLEAKNKTQLVVLVNHFPSRIGGEETSQPKRFAAAKTLRGICDSLLALNGQENIVIMGDFNDEPTNLSMDSVLRAKASEYDLNNGNLFNAMYELKQSGDGSHYYKGHFSMLDQLILSSSITNCTGKICYQKSSATVHRLPWMVEAEGKYKGAPLRTFIGEKYTNGFSDHLPVYLYLTIKK